MIIFIMLITFISIGLVGILVVVTYTCVTSKSLQSFCSSFFSREPTKMTYATDEDYAERACAGFDGQYGDRNSKEIDRDFHKNLEFDGEEIHLGTCVGGHGSTSSDSDEAQIEGYCQDHYHHHSHNHKCDCTDEDDELHEEDDSAVCVAVAGGGYQQNDQTANILMMQTPQLSGLSGLFV